jgi:hypothetical protein
MEAGWKLQVANPLRQRAVDVSRIARPVSRSPNQIHTDPYVPMPRNEGVPGSIPGVGFPS